MDLNERPEVLLRSVRATLLNYGVAAIVALVFFIFIPEWVVWCGLYLGGVVFLSNLVALFVDDWRPKPRVPIQGKAVFISGCDTGFGHLLARRLDDLGLHVFAGCLFPDKEGAQSLKKFGSERMHVLPLDVTSDESVQNALKYVTENIGNNKMWAVVNNAGIFRAGELMWTPLDMVMSEVEVNTLGVIRVTKAFLPMLCRDEGRVVTLASAAGRYTFPGQVPYCMSKHATVSFCEGLRVELGRHNVRVVTIEPWVYITTNIGNQFSENLEKAWKDSPDDIKQLYPENYLEHYDRAYLNFMNASCKENPQEVVSCLEEAVLAFDPKLSYMPGTLASRLFYAFLCSVPKPIADFALYEILRKYFD